MRTWERGIGCLLTISILAPALALANCGACGPAGDASGKPTCGADCKAGPHEHKAPSANAAVVNTAALKALLGAGVKPVILDARTGKWDDGTRLPGATVLDPACTPEQAAAASPAKDALIVTYCSGTQCQASEKLADRLRELGYSNVVRYTEGLAGWTAAGNEVTKTK